jgi:hypothetical protein
MEAAMTGILDKFYVEHGFQGARVMTRSLQLSSVCRTDEEIDANVEQLIDDLEACAREMKRLLKINGGSSLFEGWPTANDDALEA